MKKTIKTLITFLFLLSLNFVSYSQMTVDSEELIEIGKIKTINGLLATCEKTGNTYTFTYADDIGVLSTNFESFSFDDTEEAFNTLYKTIIKGLKEYKKKEMYLQIPNGYIVLYFKNGSCAFGYAKSKGGLNKVSVLFSKKKIDKLFGKK